MPRPKQLGVDSPYHEVSVDLVDDNPYQPRKIIDQSSLKELAENISKFGLLHPITVKLNPNDPQRYILCAGQRRLLAFKKLKQQNIPIIVTATGDPDEIATIENLQREDVHPLELAESLGRMKERHNYTDKDLAENILHKSRGTVTELLQLLELPDDIREECRTFDIPKSQLLAIARMNSEGQQQAWEEAKAGKLTVRDAKRRQRQGQDDDAPMPKELRPVVRFLESGTKFIESLKKIETTSLTAHGDKIAELQKLHQQIGQWIKSLKKVDKRSSEPHVQTENASETAVE